MRTESIELYTVSLTEQQQHRIKLTQIAGRFHKRCEIKSYSLQLTGVRFRLSHTLVSVKTNVEKQKQ